MALKIFPTVEKATAYARALESDGCAVEVVPLVPSYTGKPVYYLRVRTAGLRGDGLLHDDGAVRQPG